MNESIEKVIRNAQKSRNVKWSRERIALYEKELNEYEINQPLLKCNPGIADVRNILAQKKAELSDNDSEDGGSKVGGGSEVGGGSKVGGGSETIVAWLQINNEAFC